MHNPKKAVIMGASSGIGYAMAQRMIADGWTLGIAARRQEPLLRLQSLAPDRVTVATIDITDPQAPDALLSLIADMGSISLYLHVAGWGKRNAALESRIEMGTVDVNAAGFCRMVGCAFRYFADKGGGHIAAITSVAATKGLGAAPAYSATKALQTAYIEALTQLSALRRLNIRFTDIRPGFVATPLIAGDTYPMTMPVDKVARRALRAVYRHHPVAVIDWRWHLLTALWRLLPHSLWRHMRIG